MFHNIRTIVFGFLVFNFFFVSADSLSSYYTYLESYKDSFGRVGNHLESEIELITDLAEALQAQENYERFFLNRGYSSSQAQEFSKLGVVAEDSRWIWIRDPIRLPNGEITGYNRFMPKSALGGINAVSILAVSDQGEVLVNLIYRHATREWEIELPRGGNDPNESSEQAAKRELQEETGYLAETIFKISSVASDSGILSNSLDLFFAQDLINQKPKREVEEAILKCQFISKERLMEGFVKGSLKLEVNEGNIIEARCRDAFLGTALLVAEHKGLL